MLLIGTAEYGANGVEQHRIRERAVHGGSCRRARLGELAGTQQALRLEQPEARVPIFTQQQSFEAPQGILRLLRLHEAQDLVFQATPP
ncbi:MAG: hypothetical protein WDM77_11735 [Steroidobacteraceae bacterium]